MDSQKERVLLGSDLSIREVLLAIDGSGLAIALIVDKGRRLTGTVTDGDIRRGLLDGVSLDDPVTRVLNTNPITVGQTADMQGIRRLFIESKVKHIPVVDREHRVIDLVTLSELLAVPLSNPDITDHEIQAVLGVLRTPQLSLGPKVIEFEEKVAAYASRRFAIAVNSGTSGLHLVVRALGLSEGDEVITTPFSFIASSNCLLFERVRPVFVDIEPHTYNIDPGRIEAAITPRTRAILAVDVFGQPARYDDLTAIAGRHGLAVIADCCESIGAEFRGRKASTFGNAAVFAFYPNKQMTTGEGGVIVTDDPETARLCRSMRNQGRGEGGGWLTHERLGYNYRMSDISAALGVAQLDRLDEILAKRQSVADAYAGRLGALVGIHLPTIDPATTRMSWFVYVVRLGDHFSRYDRDAILQELRARGIGANNYFPAIHLQPFYRDLFGSAHEQFPITERVSERTIALPFHNNVTTDEIDVVVAGLRRAIEKRLVAAAALLSHDGA